MKLVNAIINISTHLLNWELFIRKLDKFIMNHFCFYDLILFN